MLAENVQNLVYIASFLAAGIKLAVRIGAGSSFAEAVVRFGIDCMFTADLCQILFAVAHVFATFHNDGT